MVHVVWCINKFTNRHPASLFGFDISGLDWHMIMTNLSKCCSAFSILIHIAIMKRLIIPLLIQVSAVIHRSHLAMAL